MSYDTDMENITAGYSQKPLAQKLGYTPDMRIAAIDAPLSFLGMLGEIQFVPAIAPLHAAHIFLLPKDDIVAKFLSCASLISEKGFIWLSWPKKSSPLFHGMIEDDLRAAILPLSWVDIKVCAIDQDYSGLKFARRKK